MLEESAGRAVVGPFPVGLNGPTSKQPNTVREDAAYDLIMGSFDGAALDNDATQIHMPFKLMNVEVQYLVKNGIAQTVEAPSRLGKLQRPVAQEVYEALRDERVAKQLDDHKTRKRASLEGLVDKIIEGKKKKGRVIPDRETIIQDEMAKMKKVPFEFIQLDYKDPWVRDEEYIPCDFPMPSTHLDRLLLLVFEDFCLHRRYFLTTGLKFGGHFLAYPGEPTKYHAEYIIHCEDPGRETPELLLKAQGRLAIGVRKTLLIASLDPRTDKLSYRAGRTCY